LIDEERASARGDHTQFAELEGKSRILQVVPAITEEDLLRFLCASCQHSMNRHSTRRSKGLGSIRSGTTKKDDVKYRELIKMPRDRKARFKDSGLGRQLKEEHGIEDDSGKGGVKPRFSVTKKIRSCCSSCCSHRRKTGINDRLPVRAARGVNTRSRTKMRFLLTTWRGRGSTSERRGGFFQSYGGSFEKKGSSIGPRKNMTLLEDFPALRSIIDREGYRKDCGRPSELSTERGSLGRILKNVQPIVAKGRVLIKWGHGFTETGGQDALRDTSSVQEANVGRTKNFTQHKMVHPSRDL